MFVTSAQALNTPINSPFGDFLAPRTEAVVASWVDLVKADRRLVTPDRLPDLQLKDHLPRLLSSLVEWLRSGTAPVDGEAKRSADKHGEERWRQGYRLREVLLEMFWLR